ncbi:MAG: aminoacyl-histidine dipeptidase [Paludibacteraceae bacterium]|nr:aminoacyl-histidine dipeptidase [Paludibacteraceae bacterium]
MTELHQLEPKEVFGIFDQIRQIPRASKHEERISQWLVDYAAAHGIECQRDAALNVVMRVPASEGYEAHAGVILQAHMDMVCEKNGDVRHDFSTDPIETYVDGEWLRARGTTLGGDDGIGMAMALAALTSERVKHPALEALFTVDEETGLTGAFNLGEGMLHGKRLINLDSEDDGQIFIGCAGGIDTLARLAYRPVPVPAGLFAARVAVSGLTGGHSGDDINKGRANANKVLVRFLFGLSSKTEMHLVHIDGGNLRNAIAREAEATVLVPMGYKEQLRIEFNLFVSMIEAEYEGLEPSMRLTLESTEMPAEMVPDETAQRLILALYACPHGVIGMSRDMPGLVETSTNLASVKMRDGYIEVNTSQRSSVESKKHDIKQMVESALRLSGAEVTHGDGYPGWAPNVKSALLDTTRRAYVALFGAEPEVKAIHAGLECGLFLEKYPWLDMVSIGPQMYGVHSPDERLSIPSTGRCWQWLCKTLEEL